VSESDDYAKRLLADFIAARLRAKQDQEDSAPRERPKPEPVADTNHDREQSHIPGETIRRHNETPLIGRVHYPLFGLGSSN
jgi:hypothetical protein